MCACNLLIYNVLSVKTSQDYPTPDRENYKCKNLSEKKNIWKNRGKVINFHEGVQFYLHSDWVFSMLSFLNNFVLFRDVMIFAIKYLIDMRESLVE